MPVILGVSPDQPIDFVVALAPAGTADLNIVFAVHKVNFQHSVNLAVDYHHLKFEEYYSVNYTEY